MVNRFLSAMIISRYLRPGLAQGNQKPSYTGTTNPPQAEVGNWQTVQRQRLPSLHQEIEDLAQNLRRTVDTIEFQRRQPVAQAPYPWMSYNPWAPLFPGNVASPLTSSIGFTPPSHNPHAAMQDTLLQQMHEAQERLHGIAAQAQAESARGWAQERLHGIPVQAQAESARGSAQERLHCRVDQAQAQSARGWSERSQTRVRCSVPDQQLWGVHKVTATGHTYLGGVPPKSMEGDRMLWGHGTPGQATLNLVSRGRPHTENVGLETDADTRASIARSITQGSKGAQGPTRRRERRTRQECRETTSRQDCRIRQAERRGPQSQEPRRGFLP